MTSGESTDSNAVEVDGIRIEISNPFLIVLPIPENRNGANTSVRLGMSITNNTSTPFRLNPYGTFIPELVASDGQAQHRQVFTDEPIASTKPNIPVLPGLRSFLARFLSNLVHPLGLFETREIDCWFVEPGWPQVVPLTVRLCWQDNLLQLEGSTIPDDCQHPRRPNNSWSFDALHPGIYQLRFIYHTDRGTRPDSDPDTREEMGSGQLATPFVNLRLVEPVELDRTAVEVDGIRFETLVPDRVLTIPEKKRGVETYVQLGICITNNTLTPHRFSFYASLRPEIVASDGQIIRGGCLSNILIGPLESDFQLAMPGKSAIFFPDATLFWSKHDQFTLRVPAGDGGFWFFHDLKPSTYQVRFTYSNKNTEATIYRRESTDTKLIEGLWTGMVSTPFVEFCLVQP